MTDIVVRDTDRAWIASEAGEWVRLADVMYLKVRRWGEAWQAVAVMRFRVGDIDGIRDDRPAEFVLSTQRIEAAARHDIESRLADVVGLATYVPGD